MSTDSGSGGDRDLTDLALIVIGAAFLGGAALWCGAVLGALITGRGVPPGGLSDAIRAVGVPGDPASAWPEPSLLPVVLVYWLSTLLVLAFSLALCLCGWRFGKRLGGSSSRDVRRVRGLADASEMTSAAGRKAVLRRGAVARPSLAPGGSSGKSASRIGRHATESDVGYLLGRGPGGALWCSVEDSVLLLGPPRMGKGLHVVIPWVLDAPGAVVSTSTRPDTLAVTLEHRRARGPVSVFDPQGLSGLRDGLRWSPVRGCDSPRTAMIRARGLAAGVGFGSSVSEGDFWRDQTESVLRGLLHAAALSGRGAVELYRWSLSPNAADEAVAVLSRTDDAAEGWGAALDSAVHSDRRTRDSIWLGVRQSLAALADPAVLAAVNPDEGEVFDPARFLRESGTLFLLASAVSSGSCAPLVSAFVEDITETARSLAARSPGARLDPPLLLALDEIANLTPLPSLPSLMAEGGGSGITTLTVLQSLAQARQRWGEHAADAMWDAATVKLILGGLGKARDLEDVSRLLGDVNEPSRTVSRGGRERSTSTGQRTVPVLPPAKLRTLPFGTAVLLLRHSRPAVIDLRPWTRRSDAADLATQRRDVEASLRAGAAA